jgi:hypothetical protein
VAIAEMRNGFESVEAVRRARRRGGLAHAVALGATATVAAATAAGCVMGEIGGAQGSYGEDGRRGAPAAGNGGQGGDGETGADGPGSPGASAPGGGGGSGPAFACDDGCQPGEQRCHHNAVQICELLDSGERRWSTTEQCAKSQVCVDASCHEANPELDPGDIPTVVARYVEQTVPCGSSLADDVNERSSPPPWARDGRASRATTPPSGIAPPR